MTRSAGKIIIIIFFSSSREEVKYSLYTSGDVHVILGFMGGINYTIYLSLREISDVSNDFAYVFLNLQFSSNLGDPKLAEPIHNP